MCKEGLYKDLKEHLQFIKEKFPTQVTIYFPARSVFAFLNVKARLNNDVNTMFSLYARPFVI